MKFRHIFSLASLLLISSCIQPNEPGSTPPVSKIVSLDPSLVFQAMHFTADLGQPTSGLVFRWAFGDGDTVTVSGNDSISHTYLALGTYMLQCSASIAGSDSIIAMDSLMLTIARSATSLDKSLLRSMKRVLIFFKGRGEEYVWDLQETATSFRSYYGLTLPLNTNEMISWTDTSAFYNVSEVRSDTGENSGRPVYHQEENTQRVDIRFEGDAIRSLWMKRYNYSAWQEMQASSVDLNHNEFNVKSLALLSQSKDSIVFALGGPTLKENFQMTSREQSRFAQSPFYVQTDNGRSCTGINFRQVPAPICYVTFYP